MKNKKINILGTEYTIETHKISEDEILMQNQWCGYCAEEEHIIVVADMSEKKYVDIDGEQAQRSFWNKTLRHEIIHAFLNKSGLSASAHVPTESWAKNEEMVDWLAIQLPKIYKAFLELEIL